MTLCPGDFAAEVGARVKKLGTKLGPVRASYEDELERSAAGLSAYALAVYSLFDERWATIRERIDELLAHDATARAVAPPDDDGAFDFDFHALDLPDAGATRWAIVLAFDDSDSTVHVYLDGWTVTSLGWTH